MKPKPKRKDDKLKMKLALIQADYWLGRYHSYLWHTDRQSYERQDLIRFIKHIRRLTK